MRQARGVDGDGRKRVCQHGPAAFEVRRARSTFCGWQAWGGGGTESDGARPHSKVPLFTVRTRNSRSRHKVPVTSSNRLMSFRGAVESTIFPVMILGSGCDRSADSGLLDIRVRDHSQRRRSVGKRSGG